MRILEILRVVALLCVVLYVANAQPAPATEFQVEFMEEDTRPLHAVFNFSWTPPSGQLPFNYDSVGKNPFLRDFLSFPDDTQSGYELIVELVGPLSEEHNCSEMQGPLSIELESVSYRM